MKLEEREREGERKRRREKEKEGERESERELGNLSLKRDYLRIGYFIVLIIMLMIMKFTFY